MASDKDTDDSVGKRIRKEMKEAEKRLKADGFDDIEIKKIMRDYFAKATPKKKKSVMTAAKGGMAKMAKKKMRGGGMMKRKMAGGGMAKMAKKKKMRGGGMMKKKMMGGGMAKMSKKKKMMRGGMAKKKR
tara:strand:+ start:62 stop:451 length:390 start_codon:yes stop_codon:yes gene_type:complete